MVARRAVPGAPGFASLWMKGDGAQQGRFAACGPSSAVRGRGVDRHAALRDEVMLTVESVNGEWVDERQGCGWVECERDNDVGTARWEPRTREPPPVTIGSQPRTGPLVSNDRAHDLPEDLVASVPQDV